MRKLAVIMIVVVWMALATSCTCFLCPRLDETRHIARKGDTLAKISAAYYGSSEKVDLILEANPKIDPDIPLVPGQLVHIPFTN